MNEQSISNECEPSVVSDPRQFRLIDMFAVTTLLALVSGMAAPFVQAMPSANRNKLFVVLICQLAVLAASVILAANCRGKFLQHSGRRLGIGYCGVVQWRHWPLFKSMMCMFLLAAVQLSMAVANAMQSGRGNSAPLLVVIVYSLQLGYFTGLVLCRFTWRVYPGAIEFFEHGISLGGTKFVPWDRAEVRRSAYFADRVVVVFQLNSEPATSDTKVAQVSDALRERLLNE